MAYDTLDLIATCDNTRGRYAVFYTQSVEYLHRFIVSQWNDDVGLEAAKTLRAIVDRWDRAVDDGFRASQTGAERIRAAYDELRAIRAAAEK